ncbi:hypothetical protein PWP93_31470 [Paraburkholderia sp. A1RI-2L]|uniref:hypothetical protein n=1 Tax=Paraburkholderia sp. A1RI-2L TaxID=3028367 RepID=UPI003B7F031A
MKRAPKLNGARFLAPLSTADATIFPLFWWRGRRDAVWNAPMPGAHKKRGEHITAVPSRFAQKPASNVQCSAN